jgi:hypothetical protein
MLERLELELKAREENLKILKKYKENDKKFVRETVNKILNF